MNPLQKYPGILLQGWVGMLFILITMLITDVLEYSMRGEYEELSSLPAHDPGIVGLWFLSGMICFNVIAQMLIKTIHKKACVWRAFWISLAYTLFFVIHQIVHTIDGSGFDIHSILGMTHHILGFWATWAAYKWAKSIDSAGPHKSLMASAAH